MKDPLDQLISNYQEIMNEIIVNDIYYIDEVIIEYDENKGGDTRKIEGILEKRKNKIIKFSTEIYSNIRLLKFNKVEEILEKILIYIKTSYFKSTLSKFNNFENYNDHLQSVIENIRYILYNIDRYKNKKSLSSSYSAMPKNFIPSFLKKEILDSHESDIDSYVSSISSNLFRSDELNELKIDIKKLKKFMKNLIAIISNDKIIKLLNLIIVLNVSNKKFNATYDKIIKSLEKSKEPKVISYLIKIKELNIKDKIKKFFNYIEKEKLSFIRNYKSQIISLFYNVTLKKNKKTVI